MARSRDSLDAAAWPAARLGEALAALARASGLAPRLVAAPATPEAQVWDGEALDRWIAASAAWLGIEAERVTVSYADAHRQISGASPALLRLPGDTPRFLVLLQGEARHIRALGPDLATYRLAGATVAAALRRPLEASRTAGVDRVLDAAGVGAARRARAQAAILREQIGPAPIGDCWLLRLPPGASFWWQLRQARLVHRFGVFLAAYTGASLLWVGSWWLLGQAILGGRLDYGWLLAWTLLLLTLIPLRLFASWVQERLIIGVGGLLKQRLLDGALRLQPDEVRHHGAGQFMGQVVESDTLEVAALTGGFPALKASVELLLAAAVLAAGAGGWLHTLLLLGWVTITLLLIWRFYSQRAGWTTARLAMTHDLVERMVGHRTLQAQQPPEHWYADDDLALESYLDLSLALDRTTAWLIAFVPRGWLLLSLIILAHAFVAGGATTALAVGLGGTILAQQAFNRLNIGTAYLASALIAWQQVGPLFHAAARPVAAGEPDLALISPHSSPVDMPGQGASSSRSADDIADGSQPLLDAQGLVFRYRGRGAAILRGCSLRVYAGDQLLLEGRSGGGKSTLAALLAGLRAPESGLLLLGGVDRPTLGDDTWRRLVAAAPQFHENHVLSATFAFNLLLGRGWPPRPADLDAAEALCHELGLGDLLGRMPAGLQQMVGETGWQLSHGERSRLYLARALLQDASLIILDETFAALDPETLQLALRCALRRAPTLLVIAHP
jgi:ATP-binding cassette subfamily B protein